MATADLLRFFHPVLPARDLGRKRAALVQIAGRRFALFRDGSGQAAALADACPHRRAPLSLGTVEGGQLVCPYHGWRFAADGAGRSAAQPTLGRCDAAAFQVRERWGHLWLAGRDVDPASIPAIGWDGFSFAGSLTQLFQAPLSLALDNFSEDEHFPTVHSMLGWDASGLPHVEFQAENYDDRTEVHYRGPQRHHPSLPLFGVKAGDTYCNDWVTRFNPVHAVFTFRWEAVDTGAPRPLCIRTAVFMVPETERTTRFHIFVFVQIAEGAFLRHLLPVVRRTALILGRREVAADARFVARVAATIDTENAPDELAGMRLGKYDKPIIHNRKLLQRLYFGEPAPMKLVAKL